MEQDRFTPLTPVRAWTTCMMDDSASAKRIKRPKLPSRDRRNAANFDPSIVG